jgi:hypothetical protein
LYGSVMGRQAFNLSKCVMNFSHMKFVRSDVHVTETFRNLKVH